MTRNQVLEELTPLIRELTRSAPDDIAPAHHLENDLDLDSLTQMDLVSSLERHFSIKVLDAELTGLHTVGDLVDLVVGKV
ncbi:acyl carrier protein [Streptomyces sp. NPDC001668]|uniref:acyl carrier protein n=1 Tax=unclassified Streptomyces TaxID=2593676 RepID=UPI0033F5671C